MNKYKYEKYNYNKVLGRKWHIRHILTNREYEALTNVFTCDGEKLIDILVKHLKRSYINEYAGEDSYKYSINDFDWEWEIITPNKTYRSNETSSKKE